MRSYYSHLETTAPKTGAIASRPVFRSSAIFPAIKQDGISTRLLFLGYWLLKRNIANVECVVTLRSLEGATLYRSVKSITEAKTYSVVVDDILQEIEFPLNESFNGSIEIEFFSSVNLVFPYPAVVVNYYGPAFSSVVHVAQRVYNDYEDMQKNSQTKVPESGFNIYADSHHEPVISLINGALPVANAKMEFQFFNKDGDKLAFVKELDTIQPYQTVMIYPARELDLEGFLKDAVGAGKAKFQVNWIFPRLLVGNIQKNPAAISVTHTYYDCSSARSQEDYWRDSEPDWEPATLMVPLWCADDHFTNVYFYPIYSPSRLAIDVEVYSAQGKLLNKESKALVLESPCDQFFAISMRALLAKFELNPSELYAARLIAYPLEGSHLPARVKLGLDIGINGNQLPCNICSNLQPFIPAWESKPSSFKWLPILADQPHAVAWIMNSSPHKNYRKKAKIEITFFHEKDTSTLKRTLELEPHGFLVIDPSADQELKDFLQNSIGWMTVVTNNAYLTTYYFAEQLQGVVGGDHGF